MSWRAVYHLQALIGKIGFKYPRSKPLPFVCVLYPVSFRILFLSRIPHFPSTLFKLEKPFFLLGSCHCPLTVDAVGIVYSTLVLSFACTLYTDLSLALSYFALFSFFCSLSLYCPSASLSHLFCIYHFGLYHAIELIHFPAFTTAIQFQPLCSHILNVAHSSRDRFHHHFHHQQHNCFGHSST